MAYEDSISVNTFWKYDKDLVLNNPKLVKEITEVFQREIERAAQGQYEELIMIVPDLFLNYIPENLRVYDDLNEKSFDILADIVKDSPFKSIYLIMYDHCVYADASEELLRINPKVQILYTEEIISKFILTNGTDGFAFIAETIPFGVDQLYTYPLPSEYVKKLYGPMRQMIDKHAVKHTYEIASDFQFCTERW